MTQSTRTETIDSFYAALGEDGLVSEGAFDRHGDIEQYEEGVVDISADVQVEHEGIVDRAVAPSDCSLCNSRHTESALKPVPNKRTKYALQRLLPFLGSETVGIGMSPTHGVGSCGTCHGSGQITCSQCLGEGSVVCQQCSQKGVIETEVACPRCGQNPKRGCSACDGQGTVTTLVECGNCNGTGIVRCGECFGDGYLGCETCKTTGEIHRYSEVQWKFNISWQVNGLPSFWTRFNVNRIVEKIDWSTRRFSIDWEDTREARISAPSFSAGFLQVSYENSTYNVMVKDPTTSCQVIFDPETGQMKTSIRRAFRDLKSRVSGYFSR